MRITYDPEADASDIRLLEGRFECRAVRLNDEIVLDFADGEVLVAIEVIGAIEMGITPEHPEVILDRITGWFE